MPKVLYSNDRARLLEDITVYVSWINEVIEAALEYNCDPRLMAIAKTQVELGFLAAREALDKRFKESGGIK